MGRFFLLVFLLVFGGCAGEEAPSRIVVPLFSPGQQVVKPDGRRLLVAEGEPVLAVRVLSNPAREFVDLALAAEGPIQAVAAENRDGALKLLAGEELERAERWKAPEGEGEKLEEAMASFGCSPDEGGRGTPVTREAEREALALWEVYDRGESPVAWKAGEKAGMVRVFLPIEEEKEIHFRLRVKAGGESRTLRFLARRL